MRFVQAPALAALSQVRFVQTPALAALSQVRFVQAPALAEPRSPCASRIHFAHPAAAA